MLDSGTDAGQPTSSHNTAAWINFTTEDVGGCDQADASDMDKLVCKGENALPAVAIPRRGLPGFEYLKNFHHCPEKSATSMPENAALL